MGNNLQIFNNPEFGEIRIIGDADNPLFCLADVCKVLALRVDNVVTRLKDDPITAGVISNHPITDRLGRTQNAYFINEDGLYDVILDSRKPEAKRFRKWITGEVLPAIRKTGSYSVDKINPSSELAAVELAKLAVEREKIAVEREKLDFEQTKLFVERDQIIVEREKLADEREKLATEREKLALEREKFTIANSEEAKNFAKAQLLRELASASGDDNYSRKELVRAAAKLLKGKDFLNNEPEPVRRL